MLRLADDGVVLPVGGSQPTVPFGDLELVERRADSVWNGALIGYGVGFAVGAALVLADPCSGQGAFELCLDGPGFAAAFGGLISGPVGWRSERSATRFTDDRVWSLTGGEERIP